MIEINELIVDDPELMKLDSIPKIYHLYELIGSAILTLAEDFPEETHFVFVRIGDG